MRMGLDPERIRERAVESIYQEWHSSEFAALLKIGEPVHLQDSVLRTPFHHHFRKHLAKDYILHSEVTYPRISVEFSGGDFLWSSVQIETSPGVRHLWQGQSRLINNGYLSGVWLAGLVLLAGQSLWVATTLSVGFSFLWASHWNPLGIPALVWQKFQTGILHLKLALQAKVFDETEVLAFLVVFLSMVLFVLQRALRNKVSFLFSEKWRPYSLYGSFFLEPFFVWLAFSFYKMGQEEPWWLLYLISWVGRFLSVPLLVHRLVIERNFPHLRPFVKESQSRNLKVFPIALLIPCFFYFGMGWDWLVVLASSQEAPVLMGIKIFATAFLLAMVVGSRTYSLALGLLVFPLMLGTSVSPLNSGFLLGVFLDGLLLGWILSPWMMCSQPWRPLVERRMAWILVANSLLVGVMLPSVGIPFAVPWVLSVMVFWGFYNLTRGQEPLATR